MKRLLFAALLGLAGWGRAQEPQIRLHEDFLPPEPLPLEAPTTEPATTEPSTSDDLGRQQILIRRPAARPVRVFSETEYLYTSNVLLTDGNPQGDGVTHQTFGVSYSPQLIGRLTSTAFAKYELLRYTSRDELDFDANSAGLSLSRPIENWVTVFGGFQASRLYLSDDADEFYKAFDTTFGFWRGANIQAWGWLFYGYQLDWYATTPSQFDRVSNAGYIGLRVLPTDQLTLQLLYRLRAEEYLNHNRTDLNHLVSARLTYELCPNATLTAYAEYGNNNSDASPFDYEVFTGSGGLMLQVKF